MLNTLMFILALTIPVNVQCEPPCSVNVTIPSPTPAPTPSPIPTAPALRVKTYGYWGQPGEPANIPASFIAQNITFLSAGSWMTAPFKAAGGKYAVGYIDPTFVIVANKEPLWDTTESGWYHDSTGARVYRPYGSWGIQNILNPASPATTTNIQTTTSTMKSSFDFLEFDDISFDLLNVFYHSNATAVEAPSLDAVYQAQLAGAINASAVPVLLNGFRNQDQGLPITGDMVYLKNSNAAGAIENEGCLTSVESKSLTDWQFDENTILAIANAKKWSICWGKSSASPDASAPRLFFLASWWLTYDPDWSVAFANFANQGNLFIFPEYDIVPSLPNTTATNNISELLTNGIYVRTFKACYQAGTYIGPCGTYVNPGSSSVSIPSNTFTEALVLDQNNKYLGGRVLWSTSVPSTLAPNTAVILKGR